LKEDSKPENKTKNFAKKPANGGTPAIENILIANVYANNGSVFTRP
jgi:hypothetical protein